MGNHPHAHLAEILRREIIDPGVATSAAVGIVSHRGISWAEVLADDVRGPAIFDLASVTKPLTAVAIARLIADGSVAFDTHVGDVLVELRESPAAPCKLGELLSHRAGLPAWGALYRREPWAERAPSPLAPDEEPNAGAMLRRAASLVERAGVEVYSDIGYVLLGAIVERLTGERLSERWRALTGIDRAPNDNTRTPPTEIVPWRGVVRGEVHDENAAMLERAGGNPGHAGAFATIEQVLAFATRYLAALDGDASMLPRSLAEALIERIPGGTHTLGWDLRSGASPSSGAHFGARTFGHLGFTGTSIWIDPDARVAIALLTNRTYPSRDNVRIRAARPRVHDAVMGVIAATATRPTSS